MDIYTGNVFSVGNANTSGMSVDRFMKHMGASTQGPKESVSFEPYEGEDGLMQTSSDEYQAYTNAMRAFNDFGMQMAAKGIDVLNPNSEEGAVAARRAQQLLTRAKQHGAALRTGYEVAKEYQRQRLQTGNMGPALDTSQTVTQDALNQIVNTNPYAKQLEMTVKETNDMARSYDTQAERDDANAKINAKKGEIDTLRASLMQSGVPEEYVEILIENAKNAINSATYDPTAQQELGLKGSRVRSQNAVDAARAQKLRTEGGGGEGSAGSTLVDKVNALKQGVGYEDNRRIIRGRGPTTNLKRDYSFSGYKKGDAEIEYIEYDEDKGDAFAVIKTAGNNLNPKGTKTKRRLDVSFIRDWLKGEKEFENFESNAAQRGFIDDKGNFVPKDIDSGVQIKQGDDPLNLGI